MSSPRRFCAAVGVIGLSLTFGSCSERESGPGAGRWVETEPGVAGDGVSLHRDREVFRWSFATPEDIEPWQPMQIDVAYRIDGGSLFIRSASPDPILWRQVDFQAEEVDVIRVHHSGLFDASSLQIFWAGEGEVFSEARSMTVAVADPGGELIPYYSFDLMFHPQWQGGIRRFRIDPTNLPMQKVALYDVTAYSREIDGALLSAALAAPVKVDFGGEARNALLAPPGLPHRRGFAVLPRAVVRFAYGLQQELGPPVSFRAVVEKGGERTEIFSDRLDPASQSGTWHLAEVELEPFAGSEVSVVLETDAGETLDLFLGFPLWGHPEVFVPKPTPEERPNVLLVVVDTLRADHTSLYGYQRPTTPKLAAWAARRGVVFDHAVAPSPWTLPSHVSLFTGLGAMAHGVNYTHAAPPDLTFVAETLREAGYATAAFTGGAFVTPSYGLAQGFDLFRYYRDPLPGREGMAGKDLDAGLDQALEWIEGAREPFFLFFHTYQVHVPYAAKEPWASGFLEHAEGDGPLPEILTQPTEPRSETGWRFDARFLKHTLEPEDAIVPLAVDDLPLARALYDSGIAYTDQQLDRLWRKLAESGLEDRTLVVFTSDHGEGLGEHGSAGHANLYDFNLMVPLVMALPDRLGAGTRVPTQVRLIDVAPTVLSALRLPPPDMEGLSLLPLIEDPRAPFPREAESYAGSTNFGLSLRIANRWKYIYQHSAWQPLQGQQELFDLAQDPQELQDLADSSPRSETFRQQLGRRFEDQTSNLRVRFQNRLESSVRFSLRGKLAHAFTVKAFDLPGGLVTWEKAETRVELPPGRDVELVLEGAAEGDLLVQSKVDRVEGQPPVRNFSELVSIRGLSTPWRVKLDGGAWASAAAPLAPVETGAELIWRGRMRGRTEDPAVVDEELRKQLESLGYVP